MNCEYCQSQVHIWFQCPKKPDGWKPARLAKRSTGAKARAVTNHHGSQVAQAVEQGDASVIAQDLSCASSTLALPVDTNSEAPHCGDADPQRSGPATRKDAGREPRNPAKFDKKIWQRNYMRTYIRQYREDVKSGKRTPKPRA